jgi:hypothetical protein
MTALWYRALWEEQRAIAGQEIYVWGYPRASRRSFFTSCPR